MKRPRAFRAPAGPKERINGRIRAREVRVVGPQGTQIGILSLHEAINLARGQGMDLVEVAANANPPVCRIVDYGKFRYEQSKKEKESRKSQHVGRV
ncbi:MAG: translation initiation factor IF-3, partial [Verrucomicrobiae bacterium]|nr:translation initiation factor IF-3 [Verrucomicrobiae bacterium]